MFKLVKCIPFTQSSFRMQNQSDVHLHTHYVVIQKIASKMVKDFEIIQKEY